MILAMETLIYLGKVNLYWILLYGCYWLMLRNHTFFHWNRFYLLGSLLIAFALPLIIYPAAAPALPAIYEIKSASFSVSASYKEKESFFTWTNFMLSAYVLGIIAMLMNLARHMVQLKNFLLRGEKIKLDDCTIILINSNLVGSFSFLKWVVINRNDYENHFDAILRHEMVHTSQLHSVDILLVEILKIVFWFNPVLLLYKKSMQQVHEFLADSQAPNRENYARFLVAYALNAPVASLTNHFFKPSQIKTRIQMIYKNRTSKWLLSTYIIAIALISVTALFIAGCEQTESTSLGGAASKPDMEFAAKGENEVFAAKKIFTVVEEQPEFPGGVEEMYKFLGENIRYPESAAKANVSGRVFLSFVVTETGETKDITVLKGIGYGCDAEAIRVLSKFPKWKPGKQSGQPVNVKYNLPINFQLESDDEKKNSSKESALKIGAKKENPLIVLDGKIIGKADVSKLMPSSKIQSINVFKDKYATDKYGEKGADGVLEITTIK
jgi:TonB family protein